MVNEKSSTQGPEAMKKMAVIAVVVWWLAATIATIVSKSVMLDQYPGESGDPTAAFSDLRWLELTTLQHMVGVLASAICIKMSSNQCDLLTKENVGVVITAALGNVVGNLATNAAYALVSSSMTQTIKACEPIFMAVLLACLWKDEAPSLSVALSLVVMVIGACIFVTSDTTLNVWGACAAILSNIAFPLRNIYLKKLENTWTGAFHKYAAISFASVLLLLPVLTAKVIITKSLPVFMHSKGYMSSVFHFIYNAASIIVLASVTPIAHNILNLNKRLIVIVSNITFFSVPFTPPMALGLITYVSGYILHIFSTTKAKTKFLNLGKCLRIVCVAICFVSCLYTLGYLPYHQRSDTEIISTIHGNEMKSMSDHNNLNELDEIKKTASVIHHVDFANGDIQASQKNTQSCLLPSRLSTSWVFARNIPENAVQNIARILSDYPDLEVHMYCGNTPCLHKFGSIPGNISVNFLELHTLTSNTLLARWLARHPINKILTKGMFETHLQFVVQLAILWKYGGTYVNPLIQVHRPHLPHCSTFWVINSTSKDNFIPKLDLSNFPPQHPFVEALMEAYLDQYYTYVGNIQPNTSIFDHSKLQQDTYTQFCKMNENCPDIMHISARQLATNKDPEHFGTLSMEGRSQRKRSVNLGDEIQGFPGLQFLPFVDRFPDRVKLGDSESSDIITTFFNAWWGLGDWPPPQNIHPVWLSLHITKELQGKMSANVSYLERYAPIGCRDLDTVDYFQSLNVESFFSGCLTLMLRNPYKGQERTDEIYLVDVKSNVKSLLPPSIRERAVTLSHMKANRGRYNTIEAFKSAYEIVLKYSRAKLVITQRIHSALPCVALGTPVLFINSPSLPGGGGTKQKPSSRVTGLTPLFQTLDLYQITNQAEAKQWLRDFDWDTVAPNPHTELLRRLRATQWNVIRQHQPLYDAARKFGLPPLTDPEPDDNDSLFHLFLPQVKQVEDVDSHGNFHGLYRRALESVIRFHPASKVRVYSNNKLLQGDINVFTEAGYKVEIQGYDMNDLAQKSPVEKYVHTYSSRTDTGRSLLKLLVLYKYGGIAMDMDTLVTRSLNQLPANVVVRGNNRDNTISSTFIKFTAGHEFLRRALTFFTSYSTSVSRNNAIFEWAGWNITGSDVTLLDNDVIHEIRSISECFEIEERDIWKTRLQREVFIVQLKNTTKLSKNRPLEKDSMCKHILNEYCVLCNVIY